ncbi:MAG: S8 family serine peptidase [Caldilineaceae bacterium]|nr:S8 family serine peptidase [Caldilineaceae bacterium]
MKRPAFFLLPAILVLLACLPALGAPTARAQELDQPLVPAYVPGQLIIRFQDGLSPEEIDAFYKEYGLTEMDDLNRQIVVAGEQLKLAFVPVDVNQPLIDTLERDPRVVYAEPNYILQINKTPDDPDYSKLWGLNNTGQTGGTAGADISAQDGWDVSTGSSSVVVAIIDTGIDYTHEDLAANIWVNPTECPQGYGKCEADGTDDDDNGYIDDFYGINAVTNSGDPMDDYGHGTHVAGTIGAVGNNGKGVVGVDWTVKIVACKFLSATGGGTVADAVKCFNYVNHLKNEQNVKIIATNNSWGGAAPSQALQDAMAGPDQPLHICAAGNGNSDATHYPAGFDLDNIIAVAATDHSDLYADFSNFGNWVDIAAPGVNILSTVPTGSCPICDPSGYATISGTSMATPHVTGAVALIASKYSTLELNQIRQRIVTGFDPLGDTSKTTLTNGRLNVFNTLEEDTTAPAPVADLAATELLLTQVKLAWTATGDDGMNGTANAYDVRYSTSPLSPETWENATQAVGEPKPQASGSPEEFVLDGLEPDTTYYFAMKVLDNVGNASPLSNIVIGKTSAGSIVFADNMESGPGEWQTAGTDGLWHISEHRANSPTHAWYYGDEDKQSYDTGGANSGTLTSPPIELTTNQDVLLTFYEWSQLENSDTYDRTRVQLSIDEGTTWETIFESHGTNDAWVRRAVSLTPYVSDSKTVQIRFWFDTIDNRFNTFEGWYIDDVQVLVAVPSAPGAGPAQPNLVMQESNIGLSSPAPEAGEQVTVYAVVINNGNAEANDVRVQFMDAGGSSPAPIGAPQTLANIPVGGSATAQIDYDTGDRPGERTLQVVVDPYNLIAEGNEADNQAQRTFTVTVPPAPDLAIDTANIVFSPATPQPGDQVTVHAVLRNDGAVDAKEVAVQFLDVTDSDAVTPIGAPQLVDLLPAGGSAAVEVTLETAGVSGDRKVKVVLDPQNTVAETDEENNEAQATLTMARMPQPNLVLTSQFVGFDTISAGRGATVTVIATVQNSGAQVANNVAVQFVDVTSGAVPIGEPQTIASIPPGGSGVAQVVYDTRGLAGDRRLEITVDPFNFIAETSEYDNEARVTLTVTPPAAPNLVAQPALITFSPPQPTQGVSVTVRAVILNDGSGSAENVVVQFLDMTGNTILPIGERQVIVSIPPGGSAQVETTYAAAGPPGTRRIQVVVDPNNFIPESNEEDNEATQTLTVTPPPLPNLSVAAGNIAFSVPMASEGDVVTITAVVMNNGTAPAERVLVQFVDVTNGAFDPIGVEQTIEVVPPGSSATAQVVYNTAGKAGSRKIQVLVDSNNLIAERDENDNEAVATLTVEAAAQANLVVSQASIGFSPPQPTAGDAVTVTITVHNQGALAAANVVVQLLDISTGESVPVGEAVIVPRIDPGSAAVVGIAYHRSQDTPLPSGERLLRVAVDPSNFIPETDETDNRATVTLTVRPSTLPNLVVQSGNIGFLPPNPVQGEAVTLTVTILNQGSSPAHDVLVQFVDTTGGGAEPIDAKQTIPTIAAGGSAAAQVIYDTTGKAGERRIRVVADPHMVIPETSESDNEAVGVLRVAGAPLPNLVVRPDTIGFSSANPAPGEPVTVTATILNNGNAEAANVVVQFVDATDNGAIPIAANQVISSIPPGGAAVAQIVYPTEGRFGDHKVQVIVDPNNLVVESDENDNRAMATLTVQKPAAANLVIRSAQIGFDPPEAGTEGTVTVFATVLNDGDAPAGQVLVQFLDVTDGGSTPIGEMQTLPGIAPGGSGVVQVDYAVPPGGDRKIQVVVDPNNTIPESSESDNSATATLKRSASSQANLVITAGNISFSPATPTAGDTVTIRAVILNSGAADAQDIVVQFSDATDSSSLPIGPHQVIASIPAGSSAEVQVTYTTQGKAGSRTIAVAVDPNNFIPESRETDNSAKAELEVMATAMPNLVVVGGNINLSPPAPTQGEPATIRAVILNHGALEARDVVVQFMDVTTGGTQPIGTPQTIARILPGSGATVQVAYNTSGKQGERTIQVTADPNNFIVESDETDNRAVKSFTLGAPPAANLVMLASNIEFEPAEPRDGDLVTVRATVMNNGTAAALDIVVRFEDVTDGAAQPIDKQRLIDSLLPGESATVQITYDTTDKAGERRIQVVVDPANTIAESDEQDNSAIALLTVAPPPAPNLVVKGENIRFSPSSPSDGQPVTITVTVLNEGPRNANTVEVKFVDATNGGEQPIGDVQVIGGIPSGGSATAQVVYDTTGKQGERLIRVVADPNNLVVETDETDNQAETALTVAPPSETPAILPNLVITSGSLAYTPTTPAPGDWVTLTISVTNDGEADASGVVVRVADTTGDEPVPVGEDQTIPSLAAGAVATVTVPYSTTNLTGTRTLKVAADPDKAIEESDETDNEATLTIPLGGETPPGEMPPGETPPGETPPGDQSGAGEARAPEENAAPLSIEMADDLIRRPNAGP